MVKNEGTGLYEFDHVKLCRLAGDLTVNLNKVIDVTVYPLEAAKNSNMRHRPIGIGVQGLAYVFMKLRIPFDSKQAIDLNREIFETIYYGALSKSCDLSEKYGPYESFPGSPASRGVLAYDLWSEPHSKYVKNVPHKLSGRWDFDALRRRVVLFGIRNSLLIAPMPTVSTSQIMGNTEAFEPITSNILSKRVLSGEYLYFNPYLFEHLSELKLWSKEMEHKIIQNGGSVLNISEIPPEVRQIYKTVWEIDSVVSVYRDAVGSLLTK